MFFSMFLKVPLSARMNWFGGIKSAADYFRLLGLSATFGAKLKEYDFNFLNQYRMLSCFVRCDILNLSD